MKKLLFILITLIFVFFDWSPSQVSAQNTCSDTANGCIFCFYNEGLAPPQYVLSSRNCKAGAQDPSSDLDALCASKPFNGSTTIEISCVPIAAPQTSYYCVTATHTCSSCTTGNCPANVQLYNSDNGGLAACTNVCRDTTPQACTGFCRTTCQATETVDNGGSCQTQGQMCCKPSAGNPAGCAAQGGSCKAACGAGESGGASNFCAAPNGMCCYPDAQADPGPVVNVNLKGTCQNNNEIDTAIGCIPIGDVNTFAAFFLKWGLGIAGGIGMLFLVYASFMVITSQGDPKRLQVGKELLMSAISGIIMLALSLFIFRILGINILGLF